MPDVRDPYNSKYCKAVNCSHRSGNKCTLPSCERTVGDKWAVYFTTYGTLADGDNVDA